MFKTNLVYWHGINNNSHRDIVSRPEEGHWSVVLGIADAPLLTINIIL